MFLTGGTGFVGKILIEKLLRCCPDIEAIHCLVRPKKGKSGAERLHEMLKEQVELEPSFCEVVFHIAYRFFELWNIFVAQNCQLNIPKFTLSKKAI